MNYKSHLIARVLMHMIIQSRLHELFIEIRNGQKPGKRKTQQAVISGIKAQYLPYMRDEAKLKNLYAFLDNLRDEKEKELKAQKNSVFVPTHRSHIIKIMKDYGYVLVDSMYDDISALRESYKKSQRIQLLFIAAGPMPHNYSYRSAILITDCWKGDKALTVSHAILHDNHLQTAKSYHIKWKEYLRVPHLPTFKDSLYEDIKDIASTCKLMWNEISRKKYGIGGKHEKWEDLLDKVIALRTKEMPYNPMSDIRRYGYPSMSPFGNIFALWSWASSAAPRIGKEKKHLTALSGQDLNTFDEQFIELLYNSKIIL